MQIASTVVLQSPQAGRIESEGRSQPGNGSAIASRYYWLRG
ncbi:MAG: hypothetical protein ACRC8Y_09460 [Chroococcales cyanobacterium]